MPNRPLSDADKAYLAGTENMARQIAAMALQDAFKRTSVPKNQFLEDTFMSLERIRAIADGTAEDITLTELVRLALALNMVPELDFEPLS